MRSIENAPCHLENVQLRSVKGPEDDNGNRTAAPRAILDVRVKVAGEKSPPWVDDLFPGVGIMLQSIAGDEGHLGVTIKSKTTVGDQHVTLHRADGELVVELAPAAVVNKVTFNVDHHGEGTVLFRLVAALDADEVAALIPYTDGADMLINTADQQPDLFEGGGGGGGEPEAPRTRKRSKKSNGAAATEHNQAATA